MIASVYKQRYKRNGKTHISRKYRGRYRFDGDYEITDIPLDTTDKQVAEQKLTLIVKEKEKERAGIIAPKLIRETAELPLLNLLEDYLADLKIKGRSEHYLRQMRLRVTRLIGDCTWKVAKDIDQHSFTQWRSAQKNLAPKTLNEYLNAIRAFMNWLCTQGRIQANPLANAEKVDIRGKQQQRRALTDEELAQLLLVSGSRRLLYLTAVFTGLRQNELKQLVWADVHLEEARPFIRARASTTKNSKEAVIPLHPMLVAELKAIKPEVNGRGDAVFFVCTHPSRTLHKDLKKAGIPIVD